MTMQPKGFQMIPDRYKTLEDVTAALRQAGLESSQLIVGIDYTKSNLWTGTKTFGGRCLHDLDHATSNPYKEVLRVMASTLKDFDDDGMIPVYGFGDIRTKSSHVFSFNVDDVPCEGLTGVLDRYESVCSSVKLSGPTSFAALIRQAVAVVRRTNEYHILLIIADGQVDQVQETVDAIVEASAYALSIVMIGVGDGPWGLMETFDDELPQRRFDNFQFVDFNSVFRRYPGQTRDAAFAVHALMEIPEQYQFIKQAGLLGTDRRMPLFSCVPPPLDPPDINKLEKDAKDPTLCKVYRSTLQGAQWQHPNSFVNGVVVGKSVPGGGPPLHISGV